MLMENTNPIQEELKEISPELASILPEKKAVPIPDPAYFEQFSVKMLDKLNEVPVIQMKTRKPLIRYIMGSVAAAAIIGVLFMIILDINKSEPISSDITVELAKLSNEDLEAFLASGDQNEVNADVQEQLKTLDLHEIKSFDNAYILEN